MNQSLLLLGSSGGPSFPRGQSHVYHVPFKDQCPVASSSIPVGCIERRPDYLLPGLSRSGLLYFCLQSVTTACKTIIYKKFRFVCFPQPSVREERLCLHGPPFSLLRGSERLRVRTFAVPHPGPLSNDPARFRTCLICSYTSSCRHRSQIFFRDIGDSGLLLLASSDSW